MIMHEAPSRVFIFIHVPLFMKIIINCKYYNLDFFTMHAIKNKEIRIRGNPIFQTIINNNLKKTKNTILAVSKFTLSRRFLKT